VSQKRSSRHADLARDALVLGGVGGAMRIANAAHVGVLRAEAFGHCRLQLIEELRQVLWRDEGDEGESGGEWRVIGGARRREKEKDHGSCAGEAYERPATLPPCRVLNG